MTLYHKTKKSDSVSAIIVRLLVALFVILVAAACPVEGPSPEDTTEDGRTDEETTEEDAILPDPIDGYDLVLATGSFWEFYWEYSSSSSWWSSFDNGGSESSDSGYVTISLGDPATIAGNTMYEVILSGDIPDPWGGSFWVYLGASAGSIIGSADGSTIRNILNGNAAQSEYSFFRRYSVPLEIAVSSYSSMATAPISYTTNCHSAVYNSAYDDTIIIPGFDPIDGDVSTVTISEYYKPGMGPIGLNYHDYLKDVTGPSSWDTIIIDWNYSLVSTNLEAVDGFALPTPAWRIYGEMPETKKQPNAVVAGDAVYVLGGRESYTAQTAMYTEDGTGTWTGVSPVPAAWVTSTSGSGACLRAGTKLLPDTIFFAMKYNYGLSRAIRLYNYRTNTNTWSLTAESTYTMDVNDCFLWENDLVYVLCGGGTMMEYDCADSTFEYWGAIPGAGNLTYASAIVYDGCIYIVGQYNPYGDFYTTGMFVYNGTSWSQVTWSIDSIRRWNPALAVHNDRLYVFGGNGTEVVSCSIASGTVNDWQTHDSMLYGGSGLDAIVRNDQILVFGCDEGTKIEAFTPQ